MKLMNGTVTSYGFAEGIGSVEGEDGRKYDFAWPDWLYTTIIPEAGLLVSFEAVDSRALRVRATGSRTRSDCGLD